jgi:predicted RNA methylase
MNKIYCGINDLPKGKRYGDMEECASLGKVNYYGLNKIDKRVLKRLNNKGIEEAKKIKSLLSKKRTKDNRKKKIITKDNKDCEKALDLYYELLQGGKHKKVKFRNENEHKIFNNILDGVRGYDLYVTPKEIGEFILEDIRASSHWDNKIIDAGAGLLALSRPLINETEKIHVSKLTLIELNESILPVLKCYESNLNAEGDKFIKVVNNDFLEWIPKVNDYDTILSNPPFSGIIYDTKTKKNKNEKKYYLFFLIKALDILVNSKSKKYEKGIYFISPDTNYDYDNKENKEFFELVKISKPMYDNMKENIKFIGNIDDYIYKEGKSLYIDVGRGRKIEDINKFYTIDKKSIRPKVLKFKASLSYISI